MISFLDYDQFLQMEKPITSGDVFSSKASPWFHGKGLFSEEIFGPHIPFTCHCGHHGRNSKLVGSRCPTCGIEIGPNSTRKTRCAKIEFPVGIIHPTYWLLIRALVKQSVQDMMDKIIFRDSHAGMYVYNDKHFLIATSELDTLTPPQGAVVYMGVSGLEKYLEELIDNSPPEDPKWEKLRSLKSGMYIHNMLVIPPEFRPASKDGNEKKVDELNKQLRKIIEFCKTANDDILREPNVVDTISEYMKKNLYRHVYECTDFVYESFSKKEGLFRRYLMGKRVDYSARAVITPNPTIKLNQCVIPYLMALELYKIELCRSLVNKRIKPSLSEAIEDVEKCIKLNNTKYFNFVNEYLKCNEEYIFLNRQPSLHRLSMQAFEPTCGLHKVIQIHPLVCAAYNADFDGDQMAAHRPITEESNREAKEKLSVRANLLSPATGGCSLGMSQDIVMGLYHLTHPNTTETADYNGVRTTQGRIIFNNILPANFPFLNKTVDKGVLKVLMDSIVQNFPADVAMDTFDKIKTCGFEVTTQAGITISLKGLDPSPYAELKQWVFDPNIPWYEQFSRLNSDRVLNAVKENYAYRNMIDSGSRGTWLQALQMVFARGFMSDCNNKIITTPIRNSLVEGVSRSEFFTSCYGCRKGLLDTATKTGISGYLTRRLVYSASNSMLGDEDDCGTMDFITISIPETDDNPDKISALGMAKSIVGRWVYDEQSGSLMQITYENYHTFVGKTVKMRSPILCKSKHICKKCYGDLLNTNSGVDQLHSKYVGIIAGQTIGEPGTQFVMRTFHLSGVAQVGGDVTEESENEDIVNALTVANNLFRNKKGHTYSVLLSELYKLYSQYINIRLIHLEIIVSQMMRDENDRRWRLNPDRNNITPIVGTIDNVSDAESLCQAMAFGSPKRKIIGAILEGDARTEADGILERMLTNTL